MDRREHVTGSTRTELLHWQLDVALSLLELHLQDLTDHECLWEPGTPCWTVRRRSDGRWHVDPPGPATSAVVTSIGWSIWHVGYWWSQTYVDTFGSGPRRRPEEVCWPGDADLAVEWLSRLATRWTRALESLDDADLESTARSAWFLRGTRPLGYLLAWTNLELTRSATEIGAIRRLYACRHAPDRLAS
mgnify:CR=1 FL=1